jgi:enoyl-CoA hydratase
MDSAMDFSAFETMAVQVDGHIAVVSLCGPGKGNTLGPGFWDELPAVFSALDRMDDVRAVILRGAGNQFSFGLDLIANVALFAPIVGGQLNATSRAELLQTIEDWQNAVSSIANCRKPVVAAIHGWCIGGGLHLISAADMRLASSEAMFSLREVKLAICPDLGALQRLPGIIGQGATRRLAYTGEDLDAASAHGMRLIDEVLESPDALFERALAVAEMIAQNPPRVVQGIKRLIEEGTEDSVRQGLRSVAAWNAAFLDSDDLREAMTAFMEKRQPNFQGR